MELYASVKQRINIDPKQVIARLRELAVGNGYVTVERGVYYHVSEKSAGTRGVSVKDEIPKDRYDYVMALQRVLQELENKMIP